ncbi:discoidin domain-containing protein [Termitidicoccus mucosus]|uniref:F5/8 type C domain-containing protein n=1 Tax=Termitidicoccus mucosus TaxID=1184151 RepID=A0A178IH90_9BACT|nr:hypothetical protein AW736_13950 [Opitutaceae bacterium TSB47]
MKRLFIIAALLSALACAADVFLGTQRINTDSGITLGPQGIAKRYLGTQLIFEASAEEEVLLTPAMTSNTTPAPFVVAASSQFNASDWAAWRAFDQQAVNGWSSVLSAGTHWLSIRLDAVRTVTRLAIDQRVEYNWPNYYVTEFELYYRNSSTDEWAYFGTYNPAAPVAAGDTTLDTAITGLQAQELKFVFTGNHTQNGSASLGEIRLYGH